MMRYQKIYVGLDNSAEATAAVRFAVRIARHDGAELVGGHVFAARLHDRRFRAMESGLPEAYRKEPQLEKQRNVHDSLITRGLEMITGSYLEAASRMCREHHVSFTGAAREGRNFKELVRDVQARGCDLVALGAHGLGKVDGAELGSVTARVLRRVECDLLICRTAPAARPAGPILVGLDGSARSWGALQRGLQLARVFRRKLQAVAVYDPHFHRGVFRSLNEVLSDRARKVFRFEEQEKLHEDIIDSGLANVYRAHLDVARRIAADEGLAIETRLLAGKPFPQILQVVRETSPLLLLVGRLGVHSDEDMDVGSNTENLARRADTNLLVADTRCRPPAGYLVERTVAWSEEARARSRAIPESVRGVALKAIEETCLAEGYTVVTSSVLEAALRALGPGTAPRRAGAGGPDGPPAGRTARYDGAAGTRPLENREKGRETPP